MLKSSVGDQMFCTWNSVENELNWKKWSLGSFGINNFLNDFVRGADFLVHFAAVCRRFAYIEEYRPFSPRTKRWCGRDIYRCVFHDNENALVWTGPKGMEISKILG